MERRSTNVNGYTHFQFDVTAHAGSSHGVRLSGGSTGGIIEAVGDDTNVSLTIRSQGTGPITIGSTTQPVSFSGSTSPFQGFIRFTSTAVSTPNFNSTNLMVVESSVTIPGVNSSHFVMAQFRNNGIASTDMTLTNVRPTSTNDEVLFAFEKHSTVTVAASTATIDFLVFRF
jgi:hypothetical protein